MKNGFFGLLGIVFIVLKLCGVITWSWWLVLLPLYGGIIFIILLFIFLLLLEFININFKGKK